jgi:membrane-associated phospholipid phosphatase
VTVRLGATIVALAAALGCGFLGTSVSNAPPSGIDLAGSALTGEWPRVALVLTASCWWFVLVSLGAAAIVFAALRPAWRARVTFSVLTTLVAWQASDAIKNLFERSRPPYWIVYHETSWSYPSGHAMFAVVVYGLWSYYIFTSTLAPPLRGLLAGAAIGWGLGVIWSRLALGAHYVTDLIGGVLFGITMLALAIAIAGGIPRLRRVAAPSAVIPSGAP